MAKYKVKIRIGMMVTLIVCVILCPLAWGGYSVHYAAHAQDKRDDPIEFTPHVTAIVITVTPEPVLKTTVSPGQYFEENDPNRPDVGEVHGNDEFGWGKVKDEPGLVLVWMTDEYGTHYKVVDGTSDLFLGTLDPATNTRAEDGFEDYVGQREEIERKRIAAFAEGEGSGAAMLVLAWGLGLCPETGGAGCVVGILGGIAVAVGNGVRNLIILSGLNHDLENVESYLVDAFPEADGPAEP